MNISGFLSSFYLILFFASLASITTTTTARALDRINTQEFPSFKCMIENATCESLVGYFSQKNTTLGQIRSLFQVKDLTALLQANLLPPSTHENYLIVEGQTIKVPFPCRCTNGTGLSDRVPVYAVAKNDTPDFIRTNVFSGLMAAGGSDSKLKTLQQAEDLAQPRNLKVGQKVWVPLPCSCDQVEGQKVVHYAHVVIIMDNLTEIATEFGTTLETLAAVNNITDLNILRVGAVIDVPLKGQVLQNLATPSPADGAVLKRLASTLSHIPGWYGSDFCIWTGIVCHSNGFVKSISLASQNISGSLPSDLNSLSQLTTISLQNNQLSGSLPSFANLRLLQEIHLDSNSFTSIPDGIFSGLQHLQNISLENNLHLSPWPFPAELADSTTLVAFYASNSSLMGPIPDIFGSLNSLQSLRLSYNNMTGSLPSSLGETQMQNLWLENQSLSGSLDVLADMSLLKQVWLQENDFTGPIPDLSKSTGLFDLQLQHNQLTGLVPQSLIDLPGLLNISLQNNKLQGPFPSFPDSVTTVALQTNLFCNDVSGVCDPQVMTLLEVAGALGYPLKLAEAWKGNDACSKWKFVTCDASRNIIKVDLSKQGFSGTISPAFANLTSLSELYLDNNNLTSTIPATLTTLQQLKEIDLSNNDLRGEAPNFMSSVIVLTAGNKNLGHKKRATVKIILAVLVPAISIIAFSILVYAYKKRRHHSGKKDDAEQWGFQLEPDSPLRFTYHALKTATNNFDIHGKLGGGGFGTVYEGSMNDGTKIAVKRLDRVGQGKKEFLAEVQTIGSIHHINLVKLVGFCAEKMNRLLVYEHMSKGSLDKWIFDINSEDPLTWVTKRKIILHIAKGLAYLHEDCQKRIAHLDVKPQNVLLDKEFNARLSDFGLAKLMDKDQSYVMTQMRGTRGYLAPEWLGRKITEKVDVYSYGVVVMEVVFGRKNLDYSQPEESNLLIHMVKKKAEENQLSDLLDSCSDDVQQHGEEIERTLKLAICCLHSEPERRPSMSTVVRVLESASIPEDTTPYSLTILRMGENLTMEAASQLSASVLSGPR